jgi:serine protease SohB
VAAIVVVIMAIVSAAHRQKDDDDEGELQLKRLNERFDGLKENLQRRMLGESERKAWLKAKKKEKKEERKAKKKQSRKGQATASATSEEKARARVFVLDFNGDIKASDTDSLRKSITAVLSVAEPDRDEVVVRLESGGGLVHSYGLASAQLDRIRSKGVALTACVDKVAASGGYMMACVADRIVASPFAILGSIGVVAQLPNFHKILKKNDVDYEVLTAGEHKRTMTVFGENTEKGRKKFLEDLEDTHLLFKDYVSERRPELDVESIATGDIWFGRRALEIKLIDELKTSDEYLLDACERADVISVNFRRKKTLPEKLGLAASTAMEHTVWRVLGALRHRNFQ